MNLKQSVEDALGKGVTDISPLGGGCVGQVYRLRMTDGQLVVAKVDDGKQPRLATEAYMLRYLKTHSNLPVPAVLYAGDRLLIMTFLPGHSQLDRETQIHAAELLAELHAISGPAFGFEQDTLIGGLNQPNEWTDSWLEFFQRHRLLAMGENAVRSGRLPESLFMRLRRFADRLEQWLVEPEHPSLIHGDMWTTNILAHDGRITGFLDPAIYHAHPEIELAFSTLFGTFGEDFFARYQQLRPIPTGFFEVRRDIYNLYPLLVHVSLFGGSYVRSVEHTLQRFGF